MGSMGEIGGETQHKSYWTFSKQDFFPEESFQSWGNYHSALSETCFQFKENFISCSDDANEIAELQKQKFAVEITVAGGSFGYLRIELGDSVAFITAGNILLESILGSAAVARAWTSYFTSLLDSPSNSLRIHSNLAEGFNLLDPISVRVLVIAATIAMTSTRETSVFNWIATTLNTAVILFVKIAGIFQAAAIVYFAYGGFDNIATMAEETRNPSRHILLGVLGSMSIITIIYCLMALSPRAPGQAVYYSYCTSPHDPSMVCSCPTKDKTTNKCNTSYHHFKCSHCFFLKPGCLGNFFVRKHPIYLHDDGCCITCEEILCQRNHTTNKPLEVGLLPANHYCFVHGNFCLQRIESQWLGWICCNRSFLVLEDYWIIHDVTSTEKVFGVPLVPWLPSLSNAINIFLMGSLGAKAFERFGICTVVMLIYHVFFGLHSNDMAHLHHKAESTEEI
ncbi:hypothetical protein Peur_003720 [Populus x canadensis]